MVVKKPTIAQQVAEAASKFQAERTGHAPRAVSVILSEGTLVITLYGALSLAEQDLAKSPEGAAQVQDYHRQLFANDSEAFRAEIKRITGIDVREATAEVEPATGAIVRAFTTGNVDQVFSMDGSSPTETGTWTAPVSPRDAKDKTPKVIVTPN